MSTPGELGLDHGPRLVAAVVDVDPGREARLGAPDGRGHCSANGSPSSSSISRHMRSKLTRRSRWRAMRTNASSAARISRAASALRPRTRRRRARPRPAPPKPRAPSSRAHSASSSSEMWVSTTRWRRRAGRGRRPPPGSGGRGSRCAPGAAGSPRRTAGRCRAPHSTSSSHGRQSAPKVNRPAAESRLTAWVRMKCGTSAKLAVQRADLDGRVAVVLLDRERLLDQLLVAPGADDGAEGLRARPAARSAAAAPDRRCRGGRRPGPAAGAGSAAARRSRGRGR